MLAGGVTLPAATPGQAGGGYPSPAGIVSEPTSAALLAADRASCQALGNRHLAAHGPEQQHPLAEPLVLLLGRRPALRGQQPRHRGGCTTLPDQSHDRTVRRPERATGISACSATRASPGAARLNPTFSILTSTTGYFGTGTRGAPTRAWSRQYCNGSRVVPELGGVLNPPSPMNLQVAATLGRGQQLREHAVRAAVRREPDHQGDSSATTTSSPPARRIQHRHGIDAPNHDIDGQARPMAPATTSARTSSYAGRCSRSWR